MRFLSLAVFKNIILNMLLYVFLALKLVKMPLYDDQFQAFSGFVRGRPNILVWKNGAFLWGNKSVVYKTQ